MTPSRLDPVEYEKLAKCQLRVAHGAQKAGYHDIAFQCLLEALALLNTAKKLREGQTTARDDEKI